MAIAVPSWKDLLELPVWTRLNDLRTSTMKLSDSLRKIEGGKYLLVVDRDLAGNTSGGPFVTMAVWGESDGAALRAIDGALEADLEHSSAVMPPEELLPAEHPEYSAIITALKRRGEPILESGEYRIASDGAFLHKVVRSSCAAYYFRSAARMRGESPFAITHRIGSAAATSAPLHRR